MRTTHTYAVLEVSAETYREIRDKLQAAGYEDQFNGQEIDMYGIALALEQLAAASADESR